MSETILGSPRTKALTRQGALVLARPWPEQLFPLRSISLQRIVHIERDKAEQLVIFHFGERNFPPSASNSEASACFPQEAVDALLDGPAADELVHQNVFPSARCDGRGR